jgi:hypothetical protein
MSDTYRAYPLQWPAHRPRTPPAQRRKGLFKSGGKPLTIHAATKRLQDEVERLGGKLPVLSTNVETRLDGLPRSDRRPLNDDPGVCLYFHLEGEPTALPCDKYNSVEDNIADIAAHVDVTRLMERHGVGTVKEMFAGFPAIRGPGQPLWRETLGIRPDAPVNPQIIRARVAELAKRHHPDMPGGSHDRMAEINAAADRAMADIMHGNKV